MVRHTTYPGKKTLAYCTKEQLQSFIEHTKDDAMLKKAFSAVIYCGAK
jgi:hypothetical protein